MSGPVAGHGAATGSASCFVATDDDSVGSVYAPDAAAEAFVMQDAETLQTKSSFASPAIGMEWQPQTPTPDCKAADDPANAAETVLEETQALISSSPIFQDASICLPAERCMTLSTSEPRSPDSAASMQCQPAVPDVSASPWENEEVSQVETVSCIQKVCSDGSVVAHDMQHQHHLLESPRVDKMQNHDEPLPPAVDLRKATGLQMLYSLVGFLCQFLASCG